MCACRRWRSRLPYRFQDKSPNIEHSSHKISWQCRRRRLRGDDRCHNLFFFFFFDYCLSTRWGESLAVSFVRERSIRCCVIFEYRISMEISRLPKTIPLLWIGLELESSNPIQEFCHNSVLFFLPPLLSLCFSHARTRLLSAASSTRSHVILKDRLQVGEIEPGLRFRSTSSFFFEGGNAGNLSRDSPQNERIT